MPERSAWRRRIAERNPYRWTAFHVARVPPEMTDAATIDSMITETMNLIERVPGAHRINGVPVSTTDVGQASEVLLDRPLARLRHELIAHRAEKPPEGRWDALRQRVLDLMLIGIPERPPPPRHLHLLRPWLTDLIAEEIGEIDDTELAPEPDPTPIPPCGLGS